MPEEEKLIDHFNRAYKNFTDMKIGLAKLGAALDDIHAKIVEIEVKKDKEK